MKLVLIRRFRVTGILLAGILTAYVLVNCHTDHGAAVVRQTTRLTKGYFSQRELYTIDYACH